MNRPQILWILNYLSAAYRSFTIDEGEAEGVVNVWMDILQDVPFEMVQQETRKLCRLKTDFAPTPAEIYQACTESGSTLTVYQIQQKEQEQQLLELKEYHETQDVKPMPEHIAKRLEKILSKVKVSADEH